MGSLYYPFLHLTESVSHLNAFVYRLSEKTADKVHDSYRGGAPSPGSSSCFVCW